VLEDLKARIELMPGAATLLATLKQHGVHTALVSGGFRTYTGFIRQRLGFDEDHANDLEISGGKLTGRPVEPILDKDSKLASLVRIAAERQVPLPASASPSARSPWWRPRHAPGSTTATSPRCSMPRVTGRPNSRPCKGLAVFSLIIQRNDPALPGWPTTAVSCRT
jgi:hypothetical protein